jgi:hypothetical protein
MYYRTEYLLEKTYSINRTIKDMLQQIDNLDIKKEERDKIENNQEGKCTVSQLAVNNKEIYDRRNNLLKAIQRCPLEANIVAMINSKDEMERLKLEHKEQGHDTQDKIIKEMEEYEKYKKLVEKDMGQILELEDYNRKYLLKESIEKYEAFGIGKKIKIYREKLRKYKI